MDKGRFADGDWGDYAAGDGSAATPTQEAQAISPSRPETGLTVVSASPAVTPSPSG